MTQTPALDVVELCKTYSNGVEALKGISLTVQPGDFFALLGPNGAGKSTLIGILSSLVNATAGDAHIFGVSIRTERSAAMRMIGLVPQELNFNQFEKPFDICVNQAGFYGIPRRLAGERAEKNLKQLQIWDKAFQPSRMMSGGMKRRLMIARAMMNEPRLLILDEPTAGVDIEIRPPVVRIRLQTELISVVLPAPLGPSRPKNSPAGTSRSRPSRPTVPSS
jgi:ABC-2 type transport system ATP-binding protein